MDGGWHVALVPDWQEDCEFRSFAGSAADVDRPAMADDDAVNDGESETGSLAGRLCRVEWLEDPAQLRVVHAASGVRDRHADELTASLGERAGRCQCNHDSTGMIADRLGRICNEVDDDLMELSAICHDRRHLGEAFDKLDRSRKRGAQQSHRVP